LLSAHVVADGWSFPHNPKVAGSNPAPATTQAPEIQAIAGASCFCEPAVFTRPRISALFSPLRRGSGGSTTERTARRIYTTIYELDSPDAIATPEFRAMRGWYQFAPHVRSRTQVIVPVQGRSGG